MFGVFRTGSSSRAIPCGSPATKGRYLGVPEMGVDAADLKPRLITHDRLYAVLEDELGVQRIIVLRIERP